MVEGDEAYKVISVEALPDYAGDFICYGVLDGADSAYVDDSQLWKNLPAVQGRSPHALRAGGLHAPRPHYADQPARDLHRLLPRPCGHGGPGGGFSCRASGHRFS